MRAWRPVGRWLAASACFATAVAVGVVVWGPDDSAGPPTGTDVGAAPPASAGEPPLVNRMLDQLRAGQLVESQYGDSDNPVQGAPIQAVQARPGGQLQLGRLVIPRLGVDQELNNGVDEAALLHGVGHWPGTPLPGSPGNSVISGHRSTHEKPFLHLQKLRPGDAVTVTVGAQRTTYSVFKTTIVPEREYVKFVVAQPAKPGDTVLTLFACNPITAHYQRIVVQARVVKGGR